MTNDAVRAYLKLPLLRSWGQRLLLGSLVGLTAGLAVTIFLYLLATATQMREAHPLLIWTLPLAGLCIGWLYERHGALAAQGVRLLVRTMRDPQERLPLRMAFMILLSTLLTHLGGGSAGREGTAVQISASLADQLLRLVRMDQWQRRRLLIASAGAGFAAAIGTPLAGILFGMEITVGRRWRQAGWLESSSAALTAYGLTLALRAPHTALLRAALVPFSWQLLLILLVAGLVFGGVAWLFMELTQLMSLLSQRLLRSLPWRLCATGLFLALLYTAEGSFRFAGLGLSTLQAAFAGPAAWDYPWLKMIFTALTIGPGFKGGEFIPLVSVGATLGSFVSPWLGLAPSFMAALGFAAVFAGAAHTPLTAAVMAAELFGWPVLPAALLVCSLSSQCAGARGIYSEEEGLGALTSLVQRLRRTPPDHARPEL